MPIYTVRFQETLSYSMQVNAETQEEAAHFVSREIRDVGIEAMNPRLDNCDVEVWDVEMHPTSIKGGKYHPSYGLPDDLRRQVLELATESSIRLAAAFYKVAESTVYRWKKDFQK